MTPLLLVGREKVDEQCLAIYSHLGASDGRPAGPRRDKRLGVKARLQPNSLPSFPCASTLSARHDSLARAKVTDLSPHGSNLPNTAVREALAPLCMLRPFPAKKATAFFLQQTSTLSRLNRPALTKAMGRPRLGQ